jgi:membrane-bound metal-dependent hydrolase YbcI (DUF457 family)
MPSALVHGLVAGGAGFAFASHEETKLGQRTLMPMAAGGATVLLTRLPDRLEPAIHPDHRQFFHSLAFAAMVGYATQRAYRWQPTEDWQKLLKWLAVLAGVGYLTHLVCDAVTPRSLPLVGRLG